MKSVKGIGAKTAQRIIIDLQDKLGAIDAPPCLSGGAQGGHNNSRQEALIALTTLGFDRRVVRRHWTR